MIFEYSAIAQLVERLPVKEDVLGSNPSRGAKSISCDNESYEYHLYLSGVRRPL
jgi:hypothetical protein